MEIAPWIKAIEKAVSLDGIVSRPDAVPLRMRYGVRELGAMLVSLSGSQAGKQTLAEFTGIDRDKVVLQSLHASKGLEYTIVFMLALEDGVIPQYMESEQDARRLFYVGMTRARREVQLLWSGFYTNAKGRLIQKGYSPFLPELWKRLNPDA
jgi:DNA helicase-2/ATP-dependent DNA helicase PcrA